MNEWHDNSANITIVNLDPMLANTSDIYKWVESHIRGEYVLTSRYIGFKNPLDATLFRLGFTYDDAA